MFKFYENIINSQTLLRYKCVYRMEEGRSAFKILTGKSPLGKPRGRWEDNIRTDLNGMGINTRNWVDSAQHRDYWRVLLNAALNLRVP